MTFDRKTKIVATLGPKTESKEAVAALVKAGVNVFRLNFSHGEHDWHRMMVATVREVAKELSLPVSILQDLSGPKIRIGDFAEGTVTLEPGATFVMTTEDTPGTKDKVGLTYKALPKEVSVGDVIMLNDGKLQLKVEATTDTDITTTVLVGGTITGRRGVNVPGASLSIATITEKDKKDMQLGLELGVDFMTLSFVRRASDIVELKQLLGDRRNEFTIIAKIETTEGVENFDAILEETDGVMVARGDLAIEIPTPQVPLEQKRIVRACQKLGKPVIVATQMLDSMKLNPVPTRAEVSDIANAVFDGADAIMLSDETAMGEYPVEAVQTMVNVAKTVEKSELYLSCMPQTFESASVGGAIPSSIAEAARRLEPKALIVLSETGATARLLSRYRLAQPIIVLTPNQHTAASLALSSGCFPVLLENRATSIPEALALANEAAKSAGLTVGDHYILSAGTPFDQPGTTNMMLVERVS